MITQSELKKILHYDCETGIFTWRVARNNRIKIGQVAGSINTHGYIRFILNGRGYAAHRLVWIYVYGEMPSFQIDHINGVKTDNRISNLRIATPLQNAQNKRKPNSNNNTGYLGVSFQKSANRFAAKICVQGKFKHLGLYHKAEEASEAYLKAKRQLHEYCTI